MGITTGKDHRIIDAASIALEGRIGHSSDVPKLREAVDTSDDPTKAACEIAVAFIRWSQDLKETIATNKEEVRQLIEKRDIALAAAKRLEYVLDDSVSHETLMIAIKERDEAQADRMRGNCRMMSQGDNCKCGLCIRDAEIKRLNIKITSYDNQWSKIHTFLGGDASNVPDPYEKSMSGRVAYEVERLRKEIDRLLKVLEIPDDGFLFGDPPPEKE